VKKSVQLALLLLGSGMLFGSGMYLGLSLANKSNSSDITKELSPDLRKQALDLVPWFKNAVGTHIGKYFAYAPNTSKQEELLIAGDNYLVIMDSHSVSVTDISNQSSVSVINKSNNSSLVSYSTVDGNGRVVGEAIDVNRDGQADVRTKKGEPMEFCIQGRWFAIKTNGNQKQALVDGEWKDVERLGDGTYRFIK